MSAEPQTLGLDVDGTQFRLDKALEARAGIILGRFQELYPVREAITQGELRFGFLFNLKPFDVLAERLVCGTIGKAAKASPVWRDLTGYDAVLWVRAHVWTMFETEDSRDALLLHLLLHFDAAFVRGAWKLSTRDHDYAGFNDVARHFGGALPDTASLIAALARGHEPQAAAAEAVAPLFDLAQRTGTDITIEHQGRTATIHGWKVDTETGEIIDACVREDDFCTAHDAVWPPEAKVCWGTAR